MRSSAFLGLAMVSSVVAVASAAPPKAPTAPVVLKAARMFDAERGAVVSPGLVVVVGGKIAGVGAAAKVPPGAEVIDLGDATLLPGLVDAHTHLSGEASGDWKADELSFFKLSDAERALRATAYAERTLLAGFTLVRDVGSVGQVDVALRNAIADGVIAGPRMLVAVNGIGARAGHCDPTEGYRQGLFKEPGIEDGVADGADQMRAAVRFAIKHGADVVKLCASGGVLSQTDKVDSPQLTAEETAAAIEEAHALGRKVAAHAHGSEAAKRAARAGVDSIEHGSFLDDEALELMKRKGTYLVYTPVPCIRERLEKGGAPKAVVEKARAATDAMSGTLRRALAKGVKVAFGSDAAVCPHGAQGKQFAVLAAHGMSTAAALRSATIEAARLLGEDAHAGTLTVGKRADVIAVPGDPLREVAVMERVAFVMREGVIYRRP